MATVTAKSNALLVAAMDFGTTYSGYAFSMRDSPMDFQTPQTWYAGTTQLASLKTPTCLLLDSKKQFHSFGYEAENKYAELSANSDNGDWYFFQHFKMILHKNKKLSRSTTLKDISDKPMEALKVFSLSIEFLKNHLLKTLSMRAPGVHQEDIHFVITVPAIWNDSAKLFMREAATEAGIENNKLSLALEPEAASIFCQNIPTEKFKSSGKFDVARAGTEYMVVDLGGGTADITVHRKEVDGSLKSLHAATGGPWGGLAVNKEYLEFLTDIVGENVMDKFRKEEMGDYFDLLRDFETKKRTVTPENDGSLIIRIPVSLKEIYEKSVKNSFEESVNKSKHSRNITFMRDKFKVDAVFMKKLFQRTILAIVGHVSDLLNKPKMENISLLLLVGGFSECPLVHKAFYEKFGEKRIIVPHEAGLAVIKGAVYFGHTPSVISTRILGYTYGIKCRSEFREGVHPQEKRSVNEEGNYRCKDTFDIYKRAGESVKLGERVTRDYHPATSSQNIVSFSVYVSSSPNPLLVTDKGCTLIGSLKMPIPVSKGHKRTVISDVVFGDTEFMIEATDSEKKEKYIKYLDLPE